MRLKNKVCVITGAGSGIGKGAAERFAKEDTRLALNDLNEDSLSQVVQTVGEEEVVYVAGDAAEEAVAQALVKQAAGRWGRIDVLFANAGRVYVGDVTEMSVQLWNEILRNNMTSMFVWVKAVLPYMCKQRSGSIITMSSMSAFVGQEWQGISMWAYNLTKAAALQMARSMATRYGPEGIRTNAICPGHIRTRIIYNARGFGRLTDADVNRIYEGIKPTVPLGRVGQIDELVNAVVFLASEESSYMNGQGLVIDGGAIVKG